MIHPKVKAATGSAALAAWTMTLIAWIVQQYGVSIPGEVAAAVTGILSVLFTFLGGFIKRSDQPRDASGRFTKS